LQSNSAVSTQQPNIASSSDQEFVVPGQRLGHEEDFMAGSGTYVRSPHIYASLAGFVAKQVAAIPVDVAADEKALVQSEQKAMLVVTRDREPTVVPETGSVVAAQVTKVNPRYATVQILCVGSMPLKENFTGIVRVQDVRATETDKVEIYKSFRPGDIISAEVISLGDARSYYLSTAKNEYGVIFAKSVAGATLIPISWEQMQCPRTKTKEYRKVAKV